MVRLIFALGSNNEQEHNIAEAKHDISTILSDVVYSPSLWTEPIGISNKSLFLNCLGMANTQYAYNQLRHAFKRIERRLGDSHGLRTTGCVHIDIDILEYDGIKYHEADWNRPYMKELWKGLAVKTEDK